VTALIMTSLYTRVGTTPPTAARQRGAQGSAHDLPDPAQGS
jgi:hypothetical protein